MPVTVRSLIDRPELRIEVEFSGDLDRVVSWVHATELADPSAYLEGDEVIMTDGIWLTLGASPEGFVRTLRRSGVSALIYGLDAGEGIVPAELVTASRKAGLTLLSVPPDQPFIAISQAFVRQLNAQQYAVLESTVKLSADYAEASAERRGIVGLLEILSRGIGGAGVSVLGPGPRLRSAGLSGPQPAYYRIWQELSRRGITYPVTVEGRAVFPIGVTGQPDAYVLVERGLGELSGEARVAIQHALSFLARELEYESGVGALEQRFVEELIELIAAGPVADPVMARLEALGLDPSVPSVVIVAEIVDARRSQTVVQARLQASGYRAVTAGRDREIVSIVQWTADDVQLLRGLLAALRDDLGSDATLGAGVLASDARELRRSLVAARHACRFARLHRSAEGFGDYTEFGSNALLVALQDDELLTSFRSAVLGPLEAYDRTHHTDLMKTLETFFHFECHWVKTAKELYVHVNTLRNRLSRVEELTGRRLSSMSDRVDFYIALASRPSPDGRARLADLIASN
jgi:purine catabolism regulator